MDSLGRRLADLNERLKQRTHTYMVVQAVVVGLLGGLGAVGFRTLIALLERLFWGAGRLSTSWVGGLPWWQVVGVPALGGLIVGTLVHYGAREAKGPACRR